MAKVTVKTIPVYNLELTEKEIGVLYRLLANHIVGNGNVRQTLDDIYCGISSAGLGLSNRAFNTGHSVKPDRIFITE